VPDDEPTEELLKRIRVKRKKQKLEKSLKKRSQRLSKAHISEHEVANG